MQLNLSLKTGRRLDEIVHNGPDFWPNTEQIRLCGPILSNIILRRNQSKAGIIESNYNLTHLNC